MRKSSIYKIFLFISQLQGITGSILGIALGSLLGYWFNDYLNQTLSAFLPVQGAEIRVGIGLMLGILGFVCLVCAFTSLIPAYQAGRIDTVEALQSE
ncbi:MAG: FtsX-like permease family protein [Candidatus Electrothrix sp. AS4_5]|nr:FtsX-like permease family protein [Candidatus Electrothrix gigas]